MDINFKNFENVNEIKEEENEDGSSERIWENNIDNKWENDNIKHDIIKTINYNKTKTKKIKKDNSINSSKTKIKNSKNKSSKKANIKNLDLKKKTKNLKIISAKSMNNSDNFRYYKKNNTINNKINFLKKI